MQTLLKKLGLGIIAIAALVGWKFYNKSDNHDELIKQLTTACAEDTGCIEAVEKHFESCFESNYKMGSRRRSGGLNQESFLACFNEQSNVEYFTFSTQGD